MSKRTTQILLKTLCNIEISVSSIPAMEKEVLGGLKPSYEALADKINNTKRRRQSLHGKSSINLDDAQKTEKRDFAFFLAGLPLYLSTQYSDPRYLTPLNGYSYTTHRRWSGLNRV